MYQTLVKTSVNKFIIFTSFLVVCFTSCSKNNDDQPPANQKGEITGQVTPTNSAFVVRTTTGPGATVYSSVVDASGNFKFSNLPYGTYNVQPFPVAGFENVNYVSVVLDAPTKSLSAFVMPVKNDDGNITYTLDGTNYSLFSPLTSASYNGFGTNGFLMSSQTGVNSTDHWNVSVTLDNFNGVGNYPVSNTTNFNFRILKYVGPTLYQWGTINGGAGQVNVSMFDTTVHRMSGSFTVTAVPENNFTTGNLIIDNGTFNNIYYNKP